MIFHTQEEFSDDDVTETSDQRQGHCQNSCSQCHFAALVPRYYYLKPIPAIIVISFFTTLETPRNVSQLLYRPPISFS